MGLAWSASTQGARAADRRGSASEATSPPRGATHLLDSQRRLDLAVGARHGHDPLTSSTTLRVQDRFIAPPMAFLGAERPNAPSTDFRSGEAPVPPWNALPPARARNEDVVRARLDRGGVVEVSDGVLAFAVDALIDHAAAAGDFGDAIEGMRRVVAQGAGLLPEVQLAPKRNAPTARQAEPTACALCVPSSSAERHLAWRDQIVRINRYPYVPPERRHVLLLPRAHERQSFSPRMLGDALDLAGFMSCSGRRPVVAFYNGLAGNSQSHLHWHALLEHSPLERAIDGEHLPLETIRSTAHGAVCAFDHGPFIGLLVRGTRAHVLTWAERIVERIGQDPRTQVRGPDGSMEGTYNLVILSPRSGEHRLAIFPRRAAEPSPNVGSFGPYTFGAYALAGVFVVQSESVPDDFLAAVAPAARQVVVGAHELPWLRALTRGPESDLLRLRADGASARRRPMAA